MTSNGSEWEPNHHDAVVSVRPKSISGSATVQSGVPCYRYRPQLIVPVYSLRTSWERFVWWKLSLLVTWTRFGMHDRHRAEKITYVKRGH